MDGNVAAMTLAERGAYITLLCECWTEGSIAADVGALARRCHVSKVAFSRLWPALEPCFVPVYGDRLIQPRIERERQKQETYRAMKAAAGRQGGRPKAEVKQDESRGEANQSPPSSSSSSTDVFKNPQTPKGAFRRRKARNTGGAVCCHEPRCARTADCIALTLGRKAAS